MPVDFTGYWKMLANENFEEYLRALDVNVALRKIANLLKPDKEIVQDGDHMIIRTLSTFRNYIMDFQVGKEFEEDLTGIDDRKCMTTVSWDGDKLECVQKGEKEGRGWTQWIEGDEGAGSGLQASVQEGALKRSRPWPRGAVAWTWGRVPSPLSAQRGAEMPRPLPAGSVSWLCLFSSS
uniref:Nicotinamide nucleotide adenylyltransferase 3 n=1 Tax=Equus asinus TaxID=9793 RepID=A0A9L0J3T5_EQUAS